MRIDIDHLALPEPEAVLLLKAEVRRLMDAIAALADQDATLSVQGGNVIVTMDATLTDEEREAVEFCIASSERDVRSDIVASARAAVGRLGGER